GGGAFPAVRSMAGGSRQERAQRSKRGRTGDGGCRRPAECSHGPAQGFRRSRFRLLHKFRERQGPRDSRRDEGGHVLPLEVATPPGARPRPGRGRQRRGGGRLLRKQAKRKPPGRPNNRAPWKAGLRWKGRWRNIRHAMRWAVFHALLTGRAFAYCRSRSNSGTIDRSACTTASCSAEPQTGDGRKQGSTPKAWAIPPFGTTPGDGSAGLPAVHEGHERGACFVGFQTLAEQFAFLLDTVKQGFSRAAYQVSRNPKRLRGLLRHG